MVAFAGVFGPDIRRTRVPEESRKRSFWERLLGRSQPSVREEKVLQYILHRVGEGAHLQDVVQEDYVRRNASPTEVEEICARPELVQTAREHMERDFGSGELDPTRRPE
jgi:hypothetical protein